MFVALAIVLVVATSLLASLHLRGVRAAVGPNVGALIIELKRIAVPERVRHAATRVQPRTFEAQLVEALDGVEEEAAKVVATNEALGDLALTLGTRARWSPAAVRIVLLGTALLGILSLLGAFGTVTGETNADMTAHVIQAVLVCVVGVIGLGIAVMTGSRAGTLEKKQRKLADDLVETLVPGAPREESVGRRFKNRL